MMRKSGLEDIMRECNRELGFTYCLYGDAAYGQSRVIQGPFQDTPLTVAEEQFNTSMSPGRSVVFVSGCQC